MKTHFINFLNDKAKPIFQNQSEKRKAEAILTMPSKMTANLAGIHISHFIIFEVLLCECMWNFRAHGLQMVLWAPNVSPIGGNTTQPTIHNQDTK